MTRIIVKRTIHAPATHIFQAVSDIGNLPRTNPDIARVEFLSDTHTGVGTCFRETRVMKGREHVTDLEITEYDPAGRVRMVADSHGTVWDSLFTVEDAGERAELTLQMDCNAHRLLPRLLNPLFKGMIRKGLEKHLDAVKAYCETAP